MDDRNLPEVPPGQCPQCSARNAWVDLNGHLVLVTPFCHCTCKEGCDVAACMMCGYKGVENDFMEGGAMGKKYNADLQDADPDYHSSRITFREVELALYEGKDVFWRRCRVCKTAIMLMKPPVGKPRLISCKCHEPGESRVIEYTWDELRLLVDKGKIPAKEEAEAANE